MGCSPENPEFIEKARVYSLHGMSKDAWKRYDKGSSWYYEVMYPGFKYNMTDIHASIGLRQLQKIETFQNRRWEIVQNMIKLSQSIHILRYHAGYHILNIPGICMYFALIWETLRIDRDLFIEELKARNIGTSVHFIPIHLHPLTIGRNMVISRRITL